MEHLRAAVAAFQRGEGQERDVNPYTSSLIVHPDKFESAASTRLMAKLKVATVRAERWFNASLAPKDAVVVFGKPTGRKMEGACRLPKDTTALRRVAASWAIRLLNSCRYAFDAHVVKWLKLYREMLSMALGVLILFPLRFVSNSRIGVEEKMRAGVRPQHLLRPSLRLSSTDGPRTAPEQVTWKVQAKAARCARGKCCC